MISMQTGKVQFSGWGREASPKHSIFLAKLLDLLQIILTHDAHNSNINIFVVNGVPVQKCDYYRSKTESEGIRGNIKFKNYEDVTNIPLLDTQ